MQESNSSSESPVFILFPSFESRDVVEFIMGLPELVKISADENEHLSAPCRVGAR